jgi:hypothetical protein
VTSLQSVNVIARLTLSLVVVASTAASSAGQPAPVQCASSAECAQLANDAIAQSDFEHAHDLAWRALQLAPRNEPTVMYLLARTQSLSGRPHDALVMLRRLVGIGFRATDAEESADFRRVRTLNDWPSVLAAIRGESNRDPGAPTSDASVPAAANRPLESKETAPTPSPPPAAVDSATTAPASAERPFDGLAIPAPASPPTTLAYDAVSDRFVVADESSDIVKVVDERTGHLVNLVSSGWSGAYRVTAVAIDARRGDLWAAGVDITRRSYARG